MSTKLKIEDLRLAAINLRTTRDYVKEAISTLNPVEIVTPTNLEIEKKRWIELAKGGIFENPTFLYNTELLDTTIAKRQALLNLNEELLMIEPKKPDSAMHFVWECIYAALQDGISTVDLAEAIKNGNDFRAVEEVKKKYGTPKEENIEAAKVVAGVNVGRGDLEERDIDFDPPISLTDRELLSSKDHMLNAEQIKEMFIWAMTQYDDEPWSVEIADGCSAIDVRDKTSIGHPTIVVPTKRKVTGMKLAELIGHEIECHWRGSKNADLIGALKCDDEFIYEGLAVLKDKAFNKKYCGTLHKNAAYYVLAMNAALKGKSFSDTAEHILNLIPEKTANRVTKAWTYTYRVYRGITHSANPHSYAFTKDRAYFEGWLYAIELEKSGKADYLSFSTLNQTCFEKFIDLVDIDDVRKNARLDLNIQERSLEKLLRCMNYRNVAQT